MSKNGAERLVVLNRVGKSVVDSLRRLLGPQERRITTHYSQAELSNLLVSGEGVRRGRVPQSHGYVVAIAVSA